MRKFVISALLLAAMSTSAFATTFNWTTTLGAVLLVPPGASGGGGNGSGTFNDVTNLFTYEFYVFTSTANITSSGVFNAPAGVNGPLVVNTGAGLNCAGCPIIPTVSFVGNATLTAAQALQIVAGNFYFQANGPGASNNGAGGFTRGQITAPGFGTPEPSTFTMMLGGGLLLLGGLRRRK